MASARKRGGVKPEVKPSGMAPVRIFVRIGALKRFHTLKQKTTELPVEVSWDRRRRDRRVSPASAAGERRERDRRQQLPFTWEMADFVVVQEPAPQDPPHPSDNPD
jgi:hypothetical protein